MKVEQKGDVVILTMSGHLTSAECDPAIIEFHSLNLIDKFELEVRLHEMTSYDAEARAKWTETLKPYRSQLTALRLLGVQNPIIRMAGAAVGLVLGVPVTFED